MKTGIKLTALAVAMAASTQASAVIVDFTDNWGFNPAGSGIGGAVAPIDELTFRGTSFVNNIDSDVSGTLSVGDAFEDVGFLIGTAFVNNNIVIPAGVSGLGVTYGLGATFTDWKGINTSVTGDEVEFAFTSGTLDIWLDTFGVGSILDGTPGADGVFAGIGDVASISIMSLAIKSGPGSTGDIDFAAGDGRLDIAFDITSAAAGYWFVDTDEDGIADTDITTILGLGGGLAIGLTDSNNDIITPDAATIAEFVGETGLGIPSADPDIYTANDGSFRIRVPEPGILGLMGISLMGLAVVRRRKV